MGFNGVRKHQKIEDPRYLYWADRLGPAGLGGDAQRLPLHAATRSNALTREWMDAIARDYSHPCIVAWVPFNESWGVPNLPDNPARAALRPGAVSPDEDARPDAAGDRQRRLGERRDRHHRHPRLRRRPGAHRARYRADEVLPRLFKRERPGGRLLVLEGDQHAEQPIMLTEFGGIASRREHGRRGATRACDTPSDSPSAIARCCDVVRDALGLRRASATRSSPTPIRKPTDCSSPIARRSSAHCDRGRDTRHRAAAGGRARAARLLDRGRDTREVRILECTRTCPIHRRDSTPTSSASRTCDGRLYFNDHSI